MKKILKAYNKFIGRIEGRVFEKLFIRICRYYGWSNEDIARFIESVCWQIENGQFFVPTEEEKEAAENDHQQSGV